MALGRIAAIRVIIYLFAWYDVFSYSPNVNDRIGVERMLHLPMPMQP